MEIEIKVTLKELMDPKVITKAQDKLSGFSLINFNSF